MTPLALNIKNVIIDFEMAMPKIPCWSISYGEKMQNIIIIVLLKFGHTLAGENCVIHYKTVLFDLMFRTKIAHFFHMRYIGVLIILQMKNS